MEWVSVVEKLAPALAWPVVALAMFLIAIPVLHRKLGELIKAIIAIHELPKTLKETMSEHALLTKSIKDDMKTVNTDVETSISRVQAVVGELAAIRKELQIYQTEFQQDALASESQSLAGQVNVSDVTAEAAGKSTAEMFDIVIGKWTNFTRTLEGRLKDAEIEYDMRKIGRGAYALTDRRRRNHITNEEADLITSLARQARRFTRLAESKDEWLTPEVYGRFAAGVETALAAITRSRTTNGSTQPTVQGA